MSILSKQLPFSPVAHRHKSNLKHIPIHFNSLSFSPIQLQ